MNHAPGPPPLAFLTRRSHILPRVSHARMAAIRPLPEWWVNATRFVLFPRVRVVSRSHIARSGQRGEPETRRRAFPETEAAMLQHRPRASIRPWFCTLTVALLTLVLAPLAARADESTVRELPFRKGV